MRQPTEMELRVARAIYDKAVADPLASPFELATVIIHAMREPTKEMDDAGYKRVSFANTSADIWLAMIDAASPPE